jgi:hypothetical protein
LQIISINENNQIVYKHAKADDFAKRVMEAKESRSLHYFTLAQMNHQSGMQLNKQFNNVFIKNQEFMGSMRGLSLVSKLVSKPQNLNSIIASQIKRKITQRQEKLD